MKIKMDKERIFYILFEGFVLSSLLIPTLVVNKILFVIIMFLFVILSKRMNVGIKAPLLIFSVFLIGFLHGMINECDEVLAMQFLLSALMLFLIYPIKAYDIDMKRVIRKVSIPYLGVTVIYIIYSMNVVSYMLPNSVTKFSGLFDVELVNSFGEWMRYAQNAALGERGFFGNASMMAHLCTVPFMLVIIGVYFQDFLIARGGSKVYDCIVVVVAFVSSIISTTRALVLCEVIIVAVAYLKSKRKSLQILMGVIVGILAIFVFFYLVENSTIFSLQESSNRIKSGHVQGYLAELNLKNIVIGNGMATYYFSLVRGEWLAHTEITLLDFFRYFGIPLGILVYTTLLFPCGKVSIKKMRNSFSVVIFVAYLLISLTNPVLFNSLGMIVILFYWSEILKPGRVIEEL